MVRPDAIRIRLNEGRNWFPNFRADGAKKVPLQLTAIDTGAGMVELKTRVVVSYIIPDREGFDCVDSCEYAFDGICDASSLVKKPDDSWQRDDDYGGSEGLEYNYAFDDYLVDDEYILPA